MRLMWKQVVPALALGVVAGFAAAQSCGPGPWHRHRGGPGEFQERMLKEFSAKLHLTPDQHQRVSAILDAKRAKMDALRAEVHPKFDELRSSTRDEIRQLLTPEQQKTFDVMDAKHEQEMRRRRERWGPGAK